MVPLRTEFGSEYGKSTINSEAGTPSRPRLVLHDTTLEAPSAVSSRQRRSRHGWERALLSLAIGCALLFLICTCVASAWNSAVAAYVASSHRQNSIVTVHVAKGDTLWRYAARYGDPNKYILDRVQDIARDNRLASATDLTPGQTLHITVQNPIEIAKLNTASKTRIASNAVR